MADEEKDVTQDETKGKKKKVDPEPAPEPEPDQKGIANLTITQFLRSENLGYMKQGFALSVRNKNIGGKKSRQEWRQLFESYRTSPVQ